TRLWLYLPRLSIGLSPAPSQNSSFPNCRHLHRALCNSFLDQVRTVSHRGSRTSATNVTNVDLRVVNCFLSNAIKPNPESYMITKFLRAAALSALLLTTVTVAMAAGGTGNNPSSPAQKREHSSSMMGMGGMGGGMMGNCPMMGGNTGMD